MVILRIEHHTADYDSWKSAFDADPVGRAARGVQRHQVLRADDDHEFVCIELAFATRTEAEGLLSAMAEVWARVVPSLIDKPTSRIFSVTEDIAY